MTSAAAKASAGPRAAGPQDSPGFLLWRATLRWQRRIAGVLHPLKLTHVQFVLLASVWWMSDRAQSRSGLPSQRQVADHAATDVMMTSQVLRTLETRGLVTRAADPADARVKRLTVTDAGRRLAERAVIIVESADAEFFELVGEPAKLLAVLHQLADAGQPGVSDATDWPDPADPSRPEGAC